MESSAILAYNPQNSKKRVEPEVMEIEPSLADRRVKLKAKGKQKEVVHHEIIDVDMDDDCDIVLLEGKVASTKETKLLGTSSAVKLESKEVASNKKGKEISVEPGHSPEGFNPGSNNFFDLDDYIYDEDDYSALQAHFDKIDFPAGIEASFPGFPDLVPKKKEKPAAPYVTLNSHLQSYVSQVDPWLSSSKNKTAVHGQSTYYDPKKRDNPITPSVTSNSQFGAGVSKLNRVDQWLSSTSKLNRVDQWLSSSINNTPVHGHSTYSGPKHVPAQTMHSTSNFTQTSSSDFLFNNSNAQGGMPTTYVSPLPMKAGYPLGTPSEFHGSLTNNYVKLNAASGTVGAYPMNDMLSGQDATVYGPSSVSSSRSESSSSCLKKLVDGDVKKRYESFKKFDTVEDHSDHYFAKQCPSATQPAKNWAKKIQEEWKILQNDLPDTIFVRAYESRMDLLRAVIIGAEGTPYHDGLFFFDVCFPSTYPSIPPLVHYHSGGLRINPNLYKCGKVCLSLLNTWMGQRKEEKWLPDRSTMLQVLVSIQGLILNAKPYFNEPGYESSMGSSHGEKASLQYNENTLLFSLKTMVYTMKNPPKHFEDLVIGHFQHRVRDILTACKAYTEGVQVGCLVKGGVQDVDEDGNSSSLMFKRNVVSYIKKLIAAFKNIGAKEADDFSFLSAKVISAPAPVPTTNPTANAFTPAYTYNHHY